ncbi:MAG: TldD/PmbA family protein [Desulfobacteraceae bacterium]|nr:MAG: TldD/PmbA family protein [Desulfobacteraceae bacterium]
MMEKILSLAARVGDSAEVFHTELAETEIIFEDSTLTGINSTHQRGYSLRLRKGDRLGFSYTKNPAERFDLVKKAETFLYKGVMAFFTFPKQHGPVELFSFDPLIEELSVERVIKELKRVCAIISGSVQGKGQCNSAACFGTKLARVINTNGLDVSQLSSFYKVTCQILFPNSHESLRHNSSDICFSMITESRLLDLGRIYKAALPIVDIKEREMDVIFSPHAMHALMWRLQAGASAASLYEGVSRLKGMTGDKITSDKITILDDPGVVGRPDSRWFDDEGVPTSKLELIKKGVLCSFFTNLDYASKTGLEPSGHGYRNGMWGGDPISLQPVPTLSHCSILPGDKSLDEMIADIRRGVIIMGVLGAHSGNIPNGDFSLGLNPGLYIEGGKMLGRLKNKMFSGNVYNLLNNVSSIENKLYESDYGLYPHVCFDCPADPVPALPRQSRFGQGVDGKSFFR